MAITMEPAGQAGVIGFPPHQQRRDRIPVFLAAFIHSFQHGHRLGRRLLIIGQGHGINRTDLIPHLDGIEPEPRLGMHEARAGRRRIGVHRDEVTATVPFLNSLGEFGDDWFVAICRFRVEGPDDV